MSGIRKRHAQHITVKVVLAAIKGQLTTAEITAKYGVHASQITTWKKQMKKGTDLFFSSFLVFCCPCLAQPVSFCPISRIM